VQRGDSHPFDVNAQAADYFAIVEALSQAVMKRSISIWELIPLKHGSRLAAPSWLSFLLSAGMPGGR